MYFKVLATVAFITLLNQLTPISNRSSTFMDCMHYVRQELNEGNEDSKWWTNKRARALAAHFCNGGGRVGSF